MSESGSDPKRHDEIDTLRDENARLKALLKGHGISWEGVPPSPVSSAEKIALFRRLFRGRVDIYPVRWESARGDSGYSPACANEWKPGVCRKPAVRCGDCPERMWRPVTDRTIYDHLTGKHTIGVYPLLEDDTYHFLSVDFDEGEWKDDARAFLTSCRDQEIPAAIEVSRSGNGAHVWVFFSEPVPARDARQLGALLVGHTCDRTRQLSLSSYDRFFPNQDTLPKGGFGNLIALPLQKRPRERGGSVFVDETLAPHPDQWAFLASIRPLSRAELQAVLLRAGKEHPPSDGVFSPGRRTRPPGNGRRRRAGFPGRFRTP